MDMVFPLVFHVPPAYLEICNAKLALPIQAGSKIPKASSHGI